LPYALKLADNGITALREDHGFARGLNTHRGYITCKAVAEALELMPRYQEFN
jgi:alanine dehydrogenase